MTIHAFVRAPYDSYVHDQTRFWNASGVSVKLDRWRHRNAGGIAPGSAAGRHRFRNVLDGPSSEISVEDHEFPLFPIRMPRMPPPTPGKSRCWFTSVPLCVVSARVGGRDARPEVGQVTDVRLTYDPANDAMLAPVRMEIEPERVVGIGRQVTNIPGDDTDPVGKGLRAALQSGNLLTGEMLVSLDVVPDAPAATVTVQDGAFVFPTRHPAACRVFRPRPGSFCATSTPFPLPASARIWTP